VQQILEIRDKEQTPTLDTTPSSPIRTTIPIIQWQMNEFKILVMLWVASFIYKNSGYLVEHFGYSKAKLRYEIQNVRNLNRIRGCKHAGMNCLTDASHNTITLPLYCVSQISLNKGMAKMWWTLPCIFQETTSLILRMVWSFGYQLVKI